ncbi:MAG: SHOCT domain-containing protein [Candidatus Thermoplasmatota archaeon]|nr:SHOCT domain-containing protein [Candidatus Thermoplasmatota archaeon]
MEGWSMMGGWWWLWPIIWIAVALVIGILVYRDAEKRGMNGLLWLILVLLPMIGLLFLVIYLVIREERGQEMKSKSEKSAKKLLDERYARGEITTEEYREMKEEIKK